MNRYDPKVALDVFGMEKTVDQCIEECAELIHALMKFKRDRLGSKESLEEELADVAISTEQVAFLVDQSEIDRWRKLKEDRGVKRRLAFEKDHESYKAEVLKADMGKL